FRTDSKHSRVSSRPFQLSTTTDTRGSSEGFFTEWLTLIQQRHESPMAILGFSETTHGRWVVSVFDVGLRQHRLGLAALVHVQDATFHHRILKGRFADNTFELGNRGYLIAVTLAQHLKHFGGLVRTLYQHHFDLGIQGHSLDQSFASPAFPQLGVFPITVLRLSDGSRKVTQAESESTQSQDSDGKITTSTYPHIFLLTQRGELARRSPACVFRA